MLGRGLVLVLVCISLLCAHTRSEFEGILCRGVLGTPGGGRGGHCGNVPVAVCGFVRWRAGSREPLHSILTPSLPPLFWGVPGGGRGVCGGVRSANQLKVTR
jgi:hypothetical protein